MTRDISFISEILPLIRSYYVSSFHRNFLTSDFHRICVRSFQLHHLKIQYLVFSHQESNNFWLQNCQSFADNAYYLNEARHFVFFTAEFTNKSIELNLQKYNPLPYLKRYKYAMIVNTVVTPSCTDGGTTRFRQKNCVIW